MLKKGLLNLRGTDITNNPVFFGYVLLTDSTIQLYVHENRITEEIHEFFAAEGIQVLVENYEDISNGISQYVSRISSIPASTKINFGFFLVNHDTYSKDYLTKN